MFPARCAFVARRSRLPFRDSARQRFSQNKGVPLELRLTSRLGRLNLNGIVTQGIDAPWLTGRVSFETGAMRDLLVWSGQTLPLGPLFGCGIAGGRGKRCREDGYLAGGSGSGSMATSWKAR